jgi:hypothetical protein
MAILRARHNSYAKKQPPKTVNNITINSVSQGVESSLYENLKQRIAVVKGRLKDDSK